MNLTRPTVTLRRGLAPSVPRMALHQAKSEKLIFAPAGSAQNTQADQFTQHASGLHRRDLDPSSPITQFNAWFAAAQAHRAPRTNEPMAHPETCTLSTAALPSGRVSARMVYLKELEAAAADGGGGRGGFIVYSNFGTSRKAADLASNPWASLVFWWEAMERQVRVEGRATRLPRDESQRYYETRVRGSRLGAWASRQSAVLAPVVGVEEGAPEDDGRKMLEGWVEEAEQRFAGVEDIPVPEFWGGLRVVPERVEFWQGRDNRLHDRFVYERMEGEGEGDRWTLERLSP